MVTRGREFSNSKIAGRNVSEPMSSLVNELEKPTLWSKYYGTTFRSDRPPLATTRVSTGTGAQYRGNGKKFGKDGLGAGLADRIRPRFRPRAR